MPTDESLAATAPAPDPNAPQPQPFDTSGLNWGNFRAFLQQHPLATQIGAAALGPAGAPLTLAAGQNAASDALAPSAGLQAKVAAEKNLPEQAPSVPTQVAGQPSEASSKQGMGSNPFSPTPPPKLDMPGFNFGASQGRIDAATQQQAKGLQTAADANLAAAQVRAQTMADAAGQQREYLQQNQAARDAAFSKVQDQMTNVQKQFDDLSQQKIDPNHFWETRTGPQKAFAALGLALSGFGAGFNHTQPINLIGEAIDRDIAAQRDNMANKRASLEGQANLYERNYRILGDNLAAQAMTKAQMIDSLVKAGEAKAQQVGAGAVQGQAMQQIGALKQQSEQLKQATFEHLSQIHYQNNMLALDQYKAGLQAQQMGMQRQMLMAQKSINIGGQQVYIPDDKQREKLAQMQQAGTTLGAATKENAKDIGEIGILDRLQHGLNQGIGFGEHRILDNIVPEPASYAKANAAQEAAAVSSNKALGADTAQTEQQYRNMRATLNTVGSSDAAAGAGKALRDDAKIAFYSQLAQIPGMTPQRAAALTLAQFGSDSQDKQAAQQKVLSQHEIK